MSTRIMIGWRSKCASPNDNASPPFQSWVSSRRVNDGGEELWICAVLDTDSQFSAENTIRQYYPDARVSFCEVPPAWWMPDEKKT